MRLKTLTPERQVSESGLRSYSPTLGRWCSRDPIGDSAFLTHYFATSRTEEDRSRILHRQNQPLYVFIENRPVGSVDNDGLAANLKNDTGFTVLAMGNYQLTKGCRK